MPPLDLQLSDASGVPRYRQIVDQVAEQVRLGRLRAGDQLPSVRELAPHLLVSLISVRKAYAELEADGLIERRQGQGTFVAPNVAASSQSHAQRQARRLLSEAVQRARALGLPPGEIRAHVRELLERKGTRS